MTTQSPEKIKELPGDNQDDVLFNSHYGVRTIDLNRPDKMHALNGSMIHKITSRLLEWQRSDMANIVIMSSQGSKAFCAGGDVVSVLEQNKQGLEGLRKSERYFAMEYKLDHLIATYKKPYVAYMDGITMGGGAGLSMHAPIRIATENTDFTMPETGIGFFPDVGASFFLSRLEGSYGTYIALTGYRERGARCLIGGIATHYIDSSSLPSLTARLAELQFKDYDDLSTRLEIIDATLAEFETGLPATYHWWSSEIRQAIDRCFGLETVEEIVGAVERELHERPEGDRIRGWAGRTLEALNEKSPTSLRIALRQMQLGREWSITETFQREYDLAGKIMRLRDFSEGVTIRLLSKTAPGERKMEPRWKPSSLEGVKDETISAIFEPVAGEEKLQLIKTGVEDYKQYPYNMGMPRDTEVEEVVCQGGKGQDAIFKEFMKRYNDRVGVKEKIEDVLERHCSLGEDNTLSWDRR